MPLICSACEVIISTAKRNAARACASEVGQKLLRCAEAFAARDYQGRPVDSLGQWHQGVAMQRTCRREPWCGTTAQATDTAVADSTGQPDRQLHRVFQTYRVTLPASRKEASAPQPGPPQDTAMDPGAYVCQPGPSASAPVQAEVDDTTTTGPSRTLQHLCTKYKITAFQRPFYLLMIMKLLPVQWG